MFRHAKNLKGKSLSAPFPIEMRPLLKLPQAVFGCTATLPEPEPGHEAGLQRTSGSGSAPWPGSKHRPAWAGFDMSRLHKAESETGHVLRPNQKAPIICTVYCTDTSTKLEHSFFDSLLSAHRRGGQRIIKAAKCPCRQIQVSHPILLTLTPDVNVQMLWPNCTKPAKYVVKARPASHMPEIQLSKYCSASPSKLVRPAVPLHLLPVTLGAGHLMPFSLPLRIWHFQRWVRQHLGSCS